MKNMKKQKNAWKMKTDKNNKTRVFEIIICYNWKNLVNPLKMTSLQDTATFTHFIFAVL